MVDPKDDYPVGSVGADISALQEAGYDTSDVGRGNNAFNASTVGEETGSSSRDAARAGHDQRDASSGTSGIPSDRHDRGR